MDTNLDEKINYKNYNKIDLANNHKALLLPKLFKNIKKKKHIYLVIADKGYPPFGGGENWLMDTLYFFHNNNYQSIMINFYDNNNHPYIEIKTIDLNGVLIIQMPPNKTNILLLLIKYLRPKCISHQGSNRMYYMAISKILGIPFITGFCFWNDIFDMDNNFSNIDILNNQQLSISKNFNIIHKHSDYAYVSSIFVKEVIQHNFNLDIDVINTCSIIKNNMLYKPEKRRYLTIINIHYNKGGWLVPHILSKLNIECEILLIHTEKNNDIYDNKIKQCIEERNKLYTKKTILIDHKMDNIEDIYNNTKLLLIPSLVDETFCRVAYEGIMNKIPIISTNQGNLKYLLHNYADYIDKYEYDTWIYHITKIFRDNDYLLTMSNRTTSYVFENDFNKLYNNVNNLFMTRGVLIENHVGIIAPWADQGLGIQSREYYLQLQKHNYSVHIMAFKPYKSSSNNVLLQTDKSEWLYPNIHYYDVYREKIELKHIVDFVLKSRIKTIIIPEICYDPIFTIARLFKQLHVKVIAIPNIEITRYNEFGYYDIFDVILCNNHFTYHFFNKLHINTTIDYLGFNLMHPYIHTIMVDKQNTCLEFYCSGGLNSIKRKHIDLIYNTFLQLQHLNIKLFIYIQGNEIPDIKNIHNIEVIILNQTYYDIIKMHKTHDIFIHFGSHEGLGLGFYEALQSQTPVITINTPPNNEIVNNNNGWLISSSKYEIPDNNCSCIMGDLFNQEDLLKTINHIYVSNDYLNKKKYLMNHKNIDENYILNLLKYI